MIPGNGFYKVFDIIQDVYNNLNNLIMRLLKAYYPKDCMSVHKHILWHTEEFHIHEHVYFRLNLTAEKVRGWYGCFNMESIQSRRLTYV